MKIAIVDDVREETEKLGVLLSEYRQKNNTDIQTDTFESAEDFLYAFHPQAYDMAFLDIYMDGMSGIEAARRIRTADSDIILVFLTTSTEHMPEAFRVHAFDYLEKPVGKERLFELIDDVQFRLSKVPNSPTLTFISHRNEISLPYLEIVSITSLGNYLEINTQTGEVYKVRMTFSTVSDQLLQDTRFLIINRGILVNMDCVVDINEKNCRMPNGVLYPVNTREFRKLRQAWLNYTIADIRKKSLGKGNR